MIAPAETLVSKGKRLTGPEEYFCRLVALEGKSQTSAYRIAWKASRSTSSALAVRVMARPHVIARIDELRAKAIAEGIGNMQERRKHLWDKIRAKAEGKPSHADQINAIREDAILAGERRQDGSQVNVGVVVSLGDVIGGLGGSLRGGAVDVGPAAPASIRGPADTETSPALPAPAESRETALVAIPADPGNPLAGLAGSLVVAPPASASVAAPALPAGAWWGE